MKKAEYKRGEIRMQKRNEGEEREKDGERGNSARREKQTNSKPLGIGWLTKVNPGNEMRICSSFLNHT